MRTPKHDNVSIGIVFFGTCCALIASANPRYAYTYACGLAVVGLVFLANGVEALMVIAKREDTYALEPEDQEPWRASLDDDDDEDADDS